MIIHQVPGILPRLGVRSSPFNDGWHPYRASFLQRSSAVRDLTIKALGEGGAESIVLASKPGHLLWTDDARLAGLAMNEHGVKSRDGVKPPTPAFVSLWLSCTINNLQAADGCVSPSSYVQVRPIMGCVVGCALISVVAAVVVDPPYRSIVVARSLCQSDARNK